MIVGTASARAPYVVTFDTRSDSQQYRELADALRLSRTPVVISSVCYSACVIFVGQPNACVESSASLMWHMPLQDPPVEGLPLRPETLRIFERRVFGRMAPRLASYWMACARRGDECYLSDEQAISMGTRACG
jgi:hypothetical protein